MLWLCKSTPASNLTYADTICSSFDNRATFPDLTVTLGDKSWLCHKMILSQRSQWFHKACSGNFKEGGAATIEVKEHDPHALEAALTYCYTFGDLNLIERAQISGLSVAIFLVRLFAVAEFFLIKGLAGLAADAFTKAIDDDHITTQQLTEAFQEVYECTTDPDRLLRTAIKDKTISNAKYYLTPGTCPPFDELRTAVPEFASDMLTAMVGAAGDSTSETVVEGLERLYLYKCARASCGWLFQDERITAGDPDDVVSVRCDQCGTRADRSCRAWRVLRY